VASEFSHPDEKAKFKDASECAQCTLAHLQPQAVTARWLPTCAHVCRCRGTCFW